MPMRGKVADSSADKEKRAVAATLARERAKSLEATLRLLYR